MHKIILFFMACITFQTSYSQEWLSSFDAAKRLALVQDKMVLMVWEEATAYPFPVIIEDESGSKGVVDNLFQAEYLNRLIWDHFVPVIVSEAHYEELFNEMKGKRTQAYVDKFNDDSIKVMDVNGNIINIDSAYYDIVNLTSFIRKYYINTSFLKQELSNYAKQKNFTTTYYLGSKYIDAAIYLNREVRPEIIELSKIYLEEAKLFLETSDITNKSALREKIELQGIYQNLVLNKPRKVLRQLKRMDSSNANEINEPLVAFLYLTAYRMINDEKSASSWRSKVSLVNLKKANHIISSYK